MSLFQRQATKVNQNFKGGRNTASDPLNNLEISEREIHMYDIIIIGGGPAGMTAALYARRNGKTVLIIEKDGFGGQISHSPRIENYPASMSISGSEFADKLLEQVMEQGADVELETVIAAHDEGRIKRVITEEGGNYEALSLIIASGVRHRMLGISGEEELVGHGISFCAVCDGDFFSGQTVAVVGGGNSALQEATLLADTCQELILIQNLDHFTGEESLLTPLLRRSNVRAMMGTVIKDFIKKDSELAGLVLETVSDGKTHEVSCQGLFVAVGLIPENRIFEQLISLDAHGYADSGEDCTTKTSGIFVAGDCRSKNVRQLTTACADGSVAALSACRYIDSIK